MGELDNSRLNRISLLIAILVFCVYLLCISTSATARNSGEGFIRIAEIELLRTTGDIGWESDIPWGTLGRGGMRYNWHQIGQNIIAAPLYVIMDSFRLQATAFFLINIIANIITTLVLIRILMFTGVSLESAAICGLLYAFGTLSWSYAAKVPHEHSIAVAAIVCSVYFAMRYRTGMGRANLWACLAILGYGFTVRYDTILSLLPISYYVWSGRAEHAEKKYSLASTLIVAAAAFAPFVAINMAYNYIRFESIFETGYAGSTGAPMKIFGLEFVPRGMIGALFSPGKSIFLFSPVLVLTLFFVKRFYKSAQRDFFRMCAGFVVLYLLFYSYHHSWDGDSSFGPRYFNVLIPFMIIMLSPAITGFRELGRLTRYSVAMVIILSVLVQVVFVSTDQSIANRIKYGLADDSKPELSTLSQREYGVHGSWEWLWSFFDMNVAQFPLQFKVFKYTTMFQFNHAEGIPYIVTDMAESGYPHIIAIAKLMFTYDFWWLQRPDATNMASAVILMLVSLVAAAGLMIELRSKDSHEDEEASRPL